MMMDLHAIYNGGSIRVERKQHLPPCSSVERSSNAFRTYKYSRAALLFGVWVG